MASMVSALAIGLAGSFMAGGATGAEPAGELVLPQITIAYPAPGSIAIAASVLGFGAADVSATLLVERSGQSGDASTSQSRDVHLEIGRREPIAELTLSFLPGDRLFVSVTVRRDGAIVSTATLAAGDRDQAAPDHTGDRF